MGSCERGKKEVEEGMYELGKMSVALNAPSLTLQKVTISLCSLSMGLLNLPNSFIQGGRYPSTLPVVFFD